MPDNPFLLRLSRRIIGFGCDVIGPHHTCIHTVHSRFAAERFPDRRGTTDMTSPGRRRKAVELKQKTELRGKTHRSKEKEKRSQQTKL